MENEKELADELKDFLLDPSKDYRKKLTMWRVDKHGNLIWVKDKYGNKRSHYVIEKDALMDDDWLTHMRGKMDTDEFGEFVCAYFKACEMAGITELTVTLRGEFNYAFIFSEEK